MLNYHINYVTYNEKQFNKYVVEKDDASNVHNFLDTHQKNLRLLEPVDVSDNSINPVKLKQVKNDYNYQLLEQLNIKPNSVKKPNRLLFFILLTTTFYFVLRMIVFWGQVEETIHFWDLLNTYFLFEISTNLFYLFFAILITSTLLFHFVSKKMLNKKQSLKIVKEKLDSTFKVNFKSRFDLVVTFNTKANNAIQLLDNTKEYLFKKVYFPNNNLIDLSILGYYHDRYQTYYNLSNIYMENRSITLKESSINTIYKINFDFRKKNYLIEQNKSNGFIREQQHHLQILDSNISCR